MATMAVTPEVEVQARGDDFIFVEHRSLEELEEQLNKLRYEVEELHDRHEKSERFLKKFFELFVAFSVLVTPIALAFVFNHLTDQKTWNFCEMAYASCNEGEEGDNRTHYAPSIKPSTTGAFRQAIVFTLISLSFFVGIPYYYFSLEQVHRLQNWEVDDDESEYEFDELPAAESTAPQGEELKPEKDSAAEPSEGDNGGDKDGTTKNRTKSRRMEAKRETKFEKDLKELFAQIAAADPLAETAKMSLRKQLENFD